MLDKHRMFEIEPFSEVKFYPYRTAQVDGILFTVSREMKEAREFEIELSKMARVRPDNHTVYKIKSTGGSKIYIWCSDDEMRFGTILRRGDL